MRASALLLLITLSFFSCIAQAKHLGVHGTTFPVAEPDMLEFIRAKLQTMEKEGVLQEKQQQMQKQVQQSVQDPEPVENVSLTTENKSWLLDPSYVVPEDILNADGTILHPAGTTVNPLETMPLLAPLIFIDGKDDKQIEWAMRESKRLTTHTHHPKIILVAGSIMSLMKKHQMRLYFDQKGTLTKRLGIEHVPATVTQSGLKLQIDEVAYRGTK